MNSDKEKETLAVSSFIIGAIFFLIAGILNIYTSKKMNEARYKYQAAQISSNEAYIEYRNMFNEYDRMFNLYLEEYDRLTKEYNRISKIEGCEDSLF